MKGFRQSLRGLLLAPILLSNVEAQAGPPASPAVSVHAGLKQLQFSWNPVPQVSRYQLWFRATPQAPWVKYADLPRWRTSVAVNISAHLLQWNDARYQLRACNLSGCGSSPLLAVSHLMQQTVGVFTGQEPNPTARMGWTTDLSENGSTLAAAVSNDDAGGVEVFRKTTTGWAPDARLLGDPKAQFLIEPADPAVSINGSGNVIALGVHNEVRAGADPEAEPSTGAVYVFRRSSAGWARETKLTFPASPPETAFGWRVDLDESGTLLAAWRRFTDAPASGQGHVELFRYSSGAWAHLASLPAVNTDCYAMGLSGDGGTLARVCGGSVEVFTAPAWQRVASLPHEVFGMEDFSTVPRAVGVSHDGRSFAVRSVTLDSAGEFASAWVNVYRLGATGWAREASLAPGPWAAPGPIEDPHQGYGIGVSMSRDGRFLAVGAHADAAAGAGAVYPPIVGSAQGRGAVYVYERKASGWRLRQFLKPNADSGVEFSFGWSVSFARNGKDLAVAAPMTGRGVVFLY